MSKIFDAYKKQVASEPDLGDAIGRVGTQSLFPIPPPGQLKDFNRLASQILSARREDRGTVLAFSASTAGEGASFVSFNTSMILAQVYGQKVVWVDANFMSPQTQLRGDKGPSLAELLRDTGGVDRLRNGTNPVLVKAGSDLTRAKDLLASHEYRDLLNGLAGIFDIVVLDLPPMLASDDTPLMAAEADGFLLVVQQCHLKWEVIDHGLETMRDKGVHLLGAVINRRSFELPKIIYDRL